MHYLSARFAVLAAAVTFSITPLGQAARASGDKPVVRSGLEKNTILPFSTSSPNTIPYSIERYTRTLLQEFADFIPYSCTEVTQGAWTYTDSQNCGKDASGKDIKCGNVTTGTVTVTNEKCPEQTFTYAAIYYEWTAHNNQRVTDSFDATWTSPDYTQQFTFNITVPEVLPDHETTVFVDWSPEGKTFGRWRQKLHPPANDPSFDFSGQTVQEMDYPGTHSDTCWFFGSKFDPVKTITGGPPEGWTVHAGNGWGYDGVGWKAAPPQEDTVDYYRMPHVVNGVTMPPSAPCGNRFPQQMFIKTQQGHTSLPYGQTNELGGDIGRITVTSIRAGKRKTKIWLR